MDKRQKTDSNSFLAVISGPMFSGKTGKLISYAEYYAGRGIQFLILKPDIDTRYGKKAEIYSHDHKTFKAMLVSRTISPSEIARIYAKKPKVILFDEVQFFDKKRIIDVIREFLLHGIRVVAAGLMYDFARLPFGATGYLAGLADEHLELYAICSDCGAKALHTRRIAGGSSQLQVGAAESYLPVCRTCHAASS